MKFREFMMLQLFADDPAPADPAPQDPKPDTPAEMCIRDRDSADSGCRGRRQRKGWIKMNRLTRERANGIKTGCWSPEKKQDLVDVYKRQV